MEEMSVKSLIGPLISLRLTDSGQNVVAHARVRQLTLQSPSHKGSYGLCERTEMMLVIRGCSAPALSPRYREERAIEFIEILNSSMDDIKVARARTRRLTHQSSSHKGFYGLCKCTEPMLGRSRLIWPWKAAYEALADSESLYIFLKLYFLL